MLNFNISKKKMGFFYLKNRLCIAQKIAKKDYTYSLFLRIVESAIDRARESMRSKYQPRPVFRF